MRTLWVGTATCGLAAGSKKVLEALRLAVDQAGRQARVLETGCVGLCWAEPLVEVVDGDVRKLYGHVTPELAGALAEGTETPELKAALIRGEGAEREDPLAGQMRIALRRCGYIDPGSLDDYLATGGYEALKQVLTGMTAEETIAAVSESGLRGRGGGGFPTGRKWQFTRAQKSAVKYVICNADEGDPGAFMDRSLLEGDPFSVIEGMTICGFAIGANKGVIYCRAEYPRALFRLRQALALARSNGLLGDRIMGCDFHFEITVKEGAGAFVCGEETALIASIEGRRGMPRFRPPFPAISGLYGKPTNINNVETFANVPWIITNGAASYAAIGTQRSKGTKVFALAGKIRRGGLVEVPMGMAINELVNRVGGGVPEGRVFKAVQMGGPSGGCIPATMGDLPIDYENITATGAIMGSGGLIVMDDSTCMVDVARYFLSFTQAESCGKCTFCRIGTRRMLETLERITKGEGVPADLDRLMDLAEKIRQASLCGLGQTAPNPVLTTLKYFRAEYEAHIMEKRCPAHSCAALVTFSIRQERCTGCTACVKACPVAAIHGTVKNPHRIDPAVCIRCGRCVATCNFDAILKD
jgi:NADH-quinone oxidoreductase subunit F